MRLLGVVVPLMLTACGPETGATDGLPADTGGDHLVLLGAAEALRSASLHEARFQPFETKAGWRLEHPAQKLTLVLPSAGDVQLHAPGGAFELRIDGWGREGFLETPEWSSTILGDCSDVPATHLPPCLAPVEVHYQGFTERWVNREAGIEQLFEILDRQPGAGPLAIQITVDGATVDVAESAQEAYFSFAGGRVRYSGLAAWDSKDRELDLWIEATPASLRLVVDDSQATYPITVDPTLTTTSWSIDGPLAGAGFGHSVARAGDIDQDGFDDVIVGLPWMSNGQSQEGLLLLYRGSAAGLTTSPAWSFESDRAQATLGYSVAGIGDIDGDGFPDIAAGLWNDSQPESAEGRVYVFRGGPSGPTSSPWWIGEGNAVQSHYGYDVAGAGDINADGYSDLIIGAPGAANDGFFNPAKACVVWGGPTPALTQTCFQADSLVSYGRFGTSVTGLGDLNGDGYADIAVGAPHEQRTKFDQGIVYVYFGTSTGLSTAMRLEGPVDYGLFGASVAGGGDIDHDGFDDLLVGGPSLRAEEEVAGIGRAYVFRGSALGVVTTPALTVTGTQTTSQFGWSVAFAGDVDQNGFDDFLVGAPYHDAGETNEGRIYLYLARKTGVWSIPVTADADQAEAHLGYAITNAGDLDGDGYDDIAFAAPDFDPTPSLVDAGRVTAFTQLLDLDSDGDGVSARTDCDDTERAIYPGAPEVVADGVDQDCDGTDTCYADSDEDGYGTSAVRLAFDFDCFDPGESSVSTDCDDTSATIYPTATEAPADGVDQNCDGGEICFADTDLDGHGSTITAWSSDLDCDDPGEASSFNDCDDAASATNPSASELVASGADEDCDGFELCFVDSDRDSWGLTSVVDSFDLDCSDPGEASRTLDCNDALALIFPGAPEIVADGIDQDCNGGDRCFVDFDADTYGTSATVDSLDLTCSDVGESPNSNDCGDADAAIHPGVTEVIGDGIDQDCNGQELCRLDNDGDGYGVSTTVVSTDLRCDGLRESSNADDCNDTNAAIRPGATEAVADGGDQDCDGFDSCYRDVDRDTFGTTLAQVGNDLDCLDPGESSDNTDCNDSIGSVYPGAIEVVGNGIDDNCDSRELCYKDIDRDRYGTAVVVNSTDADCADPGEALNSLDCNDFSASINPGATETIGDGVDQNCDAQEQCYRDSDRDGVGTTLSVVSTDIDCTDSGESNRSTDCNDESSLVYPGATDAPGDGIDQDCTGGDRCYADSDRDGYGTSSTIASADLDCADVGESTNSADCNDTRSAIHPSASEIPVNGVDDNCDGLERCYQDNDLDRVGTSILRGSVDLDCADNGESTSNADCDDTNPSVYPGATEVVANGEDDDCSNGDHCYTDADRDTYGTSVTIYASDLDCSDPGEAVRNGDCNDAAAAIHPGATEIVSDGIDQDCDGVESCNLDEDGDSYGIDVRIVSRDRDCFDFEPEISRLEVNEGGAQYGSSVASVGDLHHDGQPDVLVGAPLAGAADAGSVFVYRGGTSGLPTTPSQTIVGAEAGAHFGALVVGLGDIDGDGHADVAIAAPLEGESNQGAVYMYRGSPAGLAVTAAWKTMGPKPDGQFGAAIGAAGDVNRDGYADLLVGAPNYGNGQSNEGAVWLYLGSASGLATTSAWFFESNLANAHLGQAVAGVGDLNRDGYADVAVSAPNAGTGSQGRIYIYHGSPTSLPSTATRTAFLSISYNRIGQTIAAAGDVNNDGYDDFLAAGGMNALYAWYGSATGVSVSPNATFHQSQANTRFGYAAAHADIDNDGYSDVIFSASMLDNGETDEGRIYAYFGSAAGLSSSRSWIHEANQSGSRLGQSVAVIGDQDADGLIDFAAGAPLWDGGSTDEGAWFLFEPRADRYATNALDCDDSNRSIHPGATEIPVDDVDQDCDGAERCFDDIDSDRFGSTLVRISLSDVRCDGAGESYLSTDCDDRNAAQYPGAAEVIADGIDQDCAGGDTCYQDSDLDTYGTTETRASSDLDCTDAHESMNDDDCNDASAAAFPGTVETVADGIDSDCNTGERCYQDLDRDGYGSGVTISSADLDCTDMGESRLSSDCNDASRNVYPSRPEIAHDGVDQDCDGSDVLDADGDGFNADFSGGTDCHDFDATAHPGASETIDGVDEDCDGRVDNGTMAFDDDGDGVTEFGGDCDDGDPLVFPGAVEHPDGVDENCDGTVDEGTSLRDDDGDDYAEADGDCDDTSKEISPAAVEEPNQWDDDCDGLVDEGTLIYDDDGDGFTELAGDCDDSAAEANPAASERVNGKDDDCDSIIDEGTRASDDDGDGYSEDEGDCDDAQVTIHPGVAEWINGLDDDCDGEVDTQCDASDDDGDSLSEAEGDCDDSDATVYPNAPERVDGKDQDCDGYPDDGTDAFDDDGDGYSELAGDCDDTLAARSPGRTELCTGAGGVPYDENCNGQVDEACDVVIETEIKGCGCSSSAPPTGPLAVLLAAVGLLRRRRAAVASVGLLLSTGCTEVQISQNRVGQLVLYPPWVDFGAVTVGDTIEVTRTARNAGSGVLEFTRANCDDTPGVELVTDLDGAQIGWAGSENNTDYLDITFRYHPDEVGLLDSACRFDLAGGDEDSIRVAVYGRSAYVGLRFVPGIIDFGVVQGVESAQTQLINAGFASVHLDSVVDTTQSFRVIGPEIAGLTLAPGDTLSFDVTIETTEPAVEAFTLSTREGFDVALELHANDCTTPLTVDDFDADGATACGGDCDENDPEVRPGLVERVDGKDQDCNGKIDDNTEVYDDDGDGYAEVEGDCNDADFTIFPGSTADRVGVDQDCDGVVEGTDRDGDGRTVAGSDCDDSDSTRRPGLPETANGKDDDCDTHIDEGTQVYDDDADGASESAGDCDDGNAGIYPGAEETLNGRDDDCDTFVDEGTRAFDDDGDGFSENGGDCNDADSAVHPGVLDPATDGKDQNCDGRD